MTYAANIYAASTLPPAAADGLLALALACLILGILLVEKRTLAHLWNGLSSFAPSREARTSS